MYMFSNGTGSYLEWKVKLLDTAMCPPKDQHNVWLNLASEEILKLIFGQNRHNWHSFQILAKLQIPQKK